MTSAATSARDRARPGVGERRRRGEARVHLGNDLLALLGLADQARHLADVRAHLIDAARDAELDERDRRALEQRHGGARRERAGDDEVPDRAGRSPRQVRGSPARAPRSPTRSSRPARARARSPTIRAGSACRSSRSSVHMLSETMRAGLGVWERAAAAAVASAMTIAAMTHGPCVGRIFCSEPAPTSPENARSIGKMDSARNAEPRTLETGPRSGGRTGCRCGRTASFSGRAWLRLVETRTGPSSASVHTPARFGVRRVVSARVLLAPVWRSRR